MKSELILPAGNLEKLKFALAYGADSVYGGLPPFSMRSRVNEFSEEDFIEGVKIAQKQGKRFFATLNIYPHNNKLEAFENHVKWLRDKVKPDALIVADPGVFAIVKEIWPQARIHLSVQANTINWRSAKYWHEQGIKRIVLARELLLPEISEIHKMVPGLELEVFVHGAICMAYSGRCLISNYMTGRDANQGICAHPCRYNYKVYLEEQERPGQFFKLEEDDKGSYLFNSKDLCAIEDLAALKKAGVTGFKVEGRSKTVYYIAIVARAYRKAISDMEKGKPFDRGLLKELDEISTRSYSKEYLHRSMGATSTNFQERIAGNKQDFVGVVREQLKKGLYRVEIRNRIEKGEEVLLITPRGDKKTKFTKIFDLSGEPIKIAHGGAGEILLESKSDLPEYSLFRKI